MNGSGRRKVSRLLRKKSVKRKLKKFFYICLSVSGTLFLLFAIFYYTPLSKIGRLAIINDIDGILSKEDIRENIGDVIKTDLGNSFSIRNLYLHFPKRLEKRLKSINPIIESIDVDWSWWNVWSISVRERKTFGHICQSSQCFAVDKEGLVFRETMDSDGIAITISDAFAKVDKYIIKKSEFAFTSGVIDFINEEVGMKVVALDRLNKGQYAGHYLITTSTGQGLYIRPDDSIYRLTRAIYIAIREVFEYVDQENVGTINTVESIDFRFGDKLFFKKKQDES